jgi:hypothetical protein
MMKDALYIKLFFQIAADLPRRLVEAVAVIEKKLEGVKLCYSISDSGKLVSVPNIEQWALENAGPEGFPHLTNGRETNYVSFYAVVLRHFIYGPIPKQQPASIMWCILEMSVKKTRIIYPGWWNCSALALCPTKWPIALAGLTTGRKR